MALNLNGVFSFYDPAPTAGELVYDFITGQVELVLALEGAAATNAAAAVAAGTGAANSATTAIAPTSGSGAGAGAGNASTGTISPASEVATATGAALDATVTVTSPGEAAAQSAEATGIAYDATCIDGSTPPVVEDDAPSHSGASSIQWAHSSFHRPEALPRPTVRVTSKKPKVLVDADEEELIALGVL
jgi:hypothetical protein